MHVFYKGNAFFQLFNFLMNWAANVAEVLLIIYRHDATEAR